MPVIHSTAEQREFLKMLYGIYGRKPFLRRDVEDKISKSMFRKLCDYNFIIKNGKYKVITMRGVTNAFSDIHYINSWKVNINNELVRKYVTENVKV